MPNRSSVRLAVSLYAVSTGAVLFSLAIFRLISFFIMPSIFFDLLLICFPIGAVAAVLTRTEPERGYGRAIPLLQLAMIATFAATLSLKYFDSMRGNLLFGQSPLSLYLQIAAFALIYSPFFLVYGGTEYLGYLAGRAALERRMNGVYAVVLFGAATAFLLSLAQEFLGITRLLLLAIGLLTVAKGALYPERPIRRAIEGTALLALLALPSVDGYFMRQFKSDKSFSVAAYVRNHAGRVGSDGRPTEVRSLHEGWGRYSYFEVLEVKDRDHHVLWGFYNDMSQWAYHPGATTERGFREAVLQPFVAGADSVAIIGAGGGRDVKLARQAGAERILAVEVEPAVPAILRGKLSDAFEGVYDQPGVTLHVGDARTWLERHDDRFDAIFFWSVGGYPQLMLEPGNMIRTRESLTEMLAHLTPDGCFFMGYDQALDPDMVLLRQYATTLEQAGAEVVAFSYGDPGLEFALIAFSPEATAERKLAWRELLQRLPTEAIGQPIRRIPDAQLVQPNFTPVTDDRPYLGGNIRNVLTTEGIRQLFYLIGTSLAIAIGVILWLLPTDETNRRPPPSIQGISILLGANFILLEHLLVLEIFRSKYMYADSLMQGMVIYLTITALGSVLLTARRVGPLMAISWIGPVLWLIVPSIGGTLVAIGALILATLVTGFLFPSIFERHSESRLNIFALDAFGAAIGALVSFFVPLLFGLTAFRTVALVGYLITSIAVLLIVFPRRGSLPDRAPRRERETSAIPVSRAEG